MPHFNILFMLKFYAIRKREFKSVYKFDLNKKIQINLLLHSFAHSLNPHIHKIFQINLLHSICFNFVPLIIMNGNILVAFYKAVFLNRNPKHL